MKALIGTLLLSFIVAAPVFGQARLVAPVDRFDFGIVPTGSVLVHHFWLKSMGQDTVTITEVKTGCSCAVSELEKKVLPPGDSVLLGITWDIGRSLGSIFRSPRVFFNGTDEFIRLGMEGQVWDNPQAARPVTAKPYRFELSRAAIKDIENVEFTLINHSDEELGVALLSVLPEQVELSLPESVPANGTASGSIRLKPGFRDEEFSTSVTLLIEDSANTHLTIPIRRKFY